VADQPMTADDVKSLVDDRSIRFIRLWFTDILGQLKSSTARPSPASTRSRSRT
jgi:glutamine synthetase